MTRLLAWTVQFVLCVSVFCLGATAKDGPKRVALVIGNSSYEFTSTLTNPRNDAEDLSKLLAKLGFEVVSGVDLDKSAMERLIRSFAEKMSGAKLGVFFYAGHGLQVGGQNYLVPTDAKLTSAIGLDFEMVRLDLVHRTMEQQAPTNVIFLDACRDNPLARNLARALGTRSASIGRGLAAVESGEGTLISFSTQPGNVALDGDGRNSPFATALVKNLGKPGEDLSSVLIKVRNDVMAATGRRQVPWDHSALTAHVYMSPAAPGPTYEEQVEQSLWDAIKDAANPILLESYLDRFPNGKFANKARDMMQEFEREATEARIAAEKQAALEKAEAAKAAALQAKIESERKATLAKQADELRKAQQEARKAREALAKAEQERLAARKASEQARDSETSAQKEEELKAAEAVRAAALRAKFISERKAALAKQADELKKARDEAQKAHEALAKAEEDRIAAEKAAIIAKDALAATKKKRETTSKETKKTANRKPVKKKTSRSAPSRAAGGGKCFSFSGKTFCE